MLGLIIGIIFVIRHCSGIVECLNIKLYSLRRNILPTTGFLRKFFKAKRRLAMAWDTDGAQQCFGLNNWSGLMQSLKLDNNAASAIHTLSSLPLVFNLSSVLYWFDNFMLPECLVAVRNALVAYYNRLEQFNNLKKTLKLEAQLFKILDGTHFEIKFAARSEMQEPDEQIGVTLILDYRIFDIRPKCSFVEKDLPDGSLEALKEQCAVFEREPLHEAFREAFIDGVGPYAMVQRIGVQPFQSRQKRKQSRAAYPYNPNDDSFHLEDCSSEDYFEKYDLNFQPIST